MEQRIYRWRKKPNSGSHSFRYEGNRYRISPGEVVVCPVECMGSPSLAYDPIAEIVDGKSIPFKGQHPYLALKEDFWVEEEKAAETGGLELVAKGGGWYDVINPDNPEKPINDKSLRKEDAADLIVSLGGVPPEDDGEQKRRRTRAK